MRRYTVEKIDGRMVVTPNRKGEYRAVTAEEVEEALKNPYFKTLTAEVLIGKHWRPLRRAGNRKKTQRPIRGYSTPEPIKPLPLYLRMLKKLRLYKDPLEKLIYKG